MDAYLQTKEQVLNNLEVSENKGLSEEQAVDNAVRFGTNSLSKPPKESLMKKIVDSLLEPMVLMLIVAAMIAVGVNVIRDINGEPTEYIECVGIVIAIGLSVAISLTMEGKSAKAFEALNQIKDDVPAKVFRNGKVRLISQKDLVVGDIVCIETGAKVPADGRLIESRDLQAEEASLTGESEPVKKDADWVAKDIDTPLAERRNMLYSGTFITAGAGRMIVTAVGDETEFGVIARELSATEKALTPLQEKLAHLGKVIAVWGVSMAGLAFIIQLCYFLARGTASVSTVSEAFIASIVLIVAAVPEGLPTTVAICLAINIIKMSKENALVKKMVACETIGCINVICSDKTGTLTENRMTVIEVCEDGKIKQPQDVSNENLLLNFCLNSTADIGFEENNYTFIGNPTECALLVATDKAGKDYQAIRRSRALAHTYPFSSETKNMTTIVEASGVATAYTKGSPEKILSMCPLPDVELKHYEEMIRTFQEKAYRVIGFAHKTLDQIPADFEASRTSVESGMIFDGFAAIADPLRKEVFEAVRNCRDAGIDIKMLTGDNIVTASAIARELQLLGDDHIAVEARDINDISDKELAAMLPKIRVIARSTPVIKMRVVKLLKELGAVVAVTGDGINDAPAIKNADIGLAMGISGTEVSKEASDVVLLDDSFSTIVKAIQWGRGIYENFQRFILFQLTVNLSSVVVVLASIIAGFPTPFTALELLWVNLIMDGPPALTLSLEPIRSSLMKNKPTPRNASIVSREMLVRIIFGGLFISALFMLQTFRNVLGATPEQQGTVLFTLFVMFQLVNAFNCRELTHDSLFRHFFDNKLMLVAFACTFLLQVAITQYGTVVFGTVPLPLAMWVKITALSATVIFVSEVFKIANRLYAKFKEN